MITTLPARTEKYSIDLDALVAFLTGKPDSDDNDKPQLKAPLAAALRTIRFDDETIQTLMDERFNTGG